MLKYHIQTVDLASAQKVIQFNSIPQDYSDLYVVISGRSDRTSDARDELFLRFNGDAGSNYSSRALRGSGSAADTLTGASTSITRINLPSATTTSSTFGNGLFYISNYASSAPKTISVDNVMENNATFSFQEIVAGLWNNTSPITRLSVEPEVGNFAAGSSVSLYGVRRGSDGRTEVASGGVITTSGGYTIHTFNTSGTFVANRNLNAEYVVIAGGAGGGRASYGGGGGAGGYRSSVIGEMSGGGTQAEALMPISAGTSLPVTVGAGGASMTNGTNSSFASIVAIGGGTGGTEDGNRFSGTSGGSGGGDCLGVASAGVGTSGQGFAGGKGNAPIVNHGSGGGGGGAGSVGVTSSGYVAGNGGAGVTSSISGSAVARAGGGGGSGTNLFTQGQGQAGGGNGAQFSPTPGTANTGGGGGARADLSGGSAGATGGSGVVIIRYLTP
jgi:hypothetical protein